MKKTLTRKKFNQIIKESNAEAVLGASKEDLDELYYAFDNLTRLLSEMYETPSIKISNK